MAEQPDWSGVDLADGGRRYSRAQGARSESPDDGEFKADQRVPAAPPPAQGPSTTDNKSPARRAFDFGAIVAILALLFTAATYMIDLQSQNRADQRQAREDLARTIGEMEALPRDYLEMLANPDPAIYENAWSYFQGELLAAVARAQDIRDAYPEIVETVDVFAIGEAQLQLENFDLAVEELAEAERLSLADGDIVIATAARRGLGTAYFGLGQPDDGRAAFERAASMDDFEDTPELVEVGHRFMTLKLWAAAELQAGECLFAAQTLVELEAIASGVDIPVDTTLLSNSIEGLRTGVEACV